MNQYSLARITAVALSFSVHSRLGATAMWYIRKALDVTEKTRILLAAVMILWMKD